MFCKRCSNERTKVRRRKNVGAAPKVIVSIHIQAGHRGRDRCCGHRCRCGQDWRDCRHPADQDRRSASARRIYRGAPRQHAAGSALLHNKNLSFLSSSSHAAYCGPRSLPADVPGCAQLEGVTARPCSDCRRFGTHWGGDIHPHLAQIHMYQVEVTIYQSDD